MTSTLNIRFDTALFHVQVSVHVPGAFEISNYVIRWAAHDKQFQQPGPAFLLMVEDDPSDGLQDV